MSHSAHSLSLYIAEHTQLVYKTEELSAANQNRAGKTSNFVRQSESSTKEPFNFVSQSESSITSPSQSESSITSPESSRFGWRSLLGSRLESARYSLSSYIGTSTPPSSLRTLLLLTCQRV